MPAIVLAILPASAHATPCAGGLFAQDGAPPPAPRMPRPAPRPAAGDSLAAARDSAGAAGDSLAAAGAAGDSSAAAGVPESTRRWWSGDWLLEQLGPAAGDTAVDRRQLFLSTASLFSQALQRHTGLGVHEGGSPIAWDLPYDLGPGVERMSLWLDGVTTSGGAPGAAHCHTVSPMLIGQVRCLAPDPFLDPLGDAGDGMIWTATQEPAWEDVPSQVRFSEGVAQSSTEDVMLGRAWGASRGLASYAHANSQGRQSYTNGIQRYGDARYQNLFFQVDRGWSPVAARASVADRAGRMTMAFDRKLVWDHTVVTGGAQTSWGQVRTTWRRDRVEWWGPDDTGGRRSRSLDLIGQAALPLGAVRLLMAAAGERGHMSVSSHAAGDSSWDANGLGLAAGLRVEGGGRVAAATAGWADPWWTRGHGRARAWLAQRFGAATELRLEGWIGRAGVFIPRLEPDGDALVREGLHLLGEDPAPDGAVRRLAHVELGGRWSGWGAAIAPALFVRRIEDALGTDPDAAATLLPGARTTASLAGGLGDATLFGGRLAGRIPIRWGLRAEGTGIVVLDPPQERLPVLVAPYRGRGGVHLARRMFKDDLWVEMGLIVLAQGQWQTPAGPVPARAQLDAEVKLLFVEQAHLFLHFCNLTDEFFESATYDGTWGALPYRSTTLGFEWHFND